MQRRFEVVEDRGPLAPRQQAEHEHHFLGFEIVEQFGGVGRVMAGKEIAQARLVAFGDEFTQVGGEQRITHGDQNAGDAESRRQEVLRQAPKDRRENRSEVPRRRP